MTTTYFGVRAPLRMRSCVFTSEDGVKERAQAAHGGHGHSRTHDRQRRFDPRPEPAPRPLHRGGAFHGAGRNRASPLRGKENFVREETWLKSAKSFRSEHFRTQQLTNQEEEDFHRPLGGSSSFQPFFSFHFISLYLFNHEN